MESRRRTTSKSKAATSSAALFAAVFLSGLISGDAYVNYDLPPATQKAMLQKMTASVHQAPMGTLTPETIQTLPEIMAACVQSQQSVSGARRKRKNANNDDSDNSLECVVEAEQLLKRLIDERHSGNEYAIPTTDAYNAILYGWANSGMGSAAASRAEEILFEMQQMYSIEVSLEEDEEDEKASKQHYAVQHNADKYRHYSVQPNTESFRSVLNAWLSAVQDGDDEASKISAAQRALDILTWMIKLHQTGNNDMASPDSNCFEIVMMAWAQSGHREGAERVEKLLEIQCQMYEMLNYNDLQPNSRCYDQVIHAWGKRAESSSAAAERVEAILSHMELLESQGFEDAGPTLSSYTTVCAALAKQTGLKGARKAESILRRVEERCLAGETDFRPDALSYNLVVDAYVKARAKNSYRLARSILERQIKMAKAHGITRCQADVYGYTMVINGCASTYGSRSDRLQAYEVAEATFEDMISSGVKPNHVTYGTMLKAIAKLLPNGERRDDAVRDLFAKCCQDGCVSPVVLKALRMASSPLLIDELKLDDQVPLGWSRNVPAKSKGCNKGRRPRRRAEV